MPRRATQQQPLSNNNYSDKSNNEAKHNDDDTLTRAIGGSTIRAAVQHALHEFVILLLAWKRFYPQLLCDLPEDDDSTALVVERDEMEGNQIKTTSAFFYRKGQHVNGAYMSPNECCIKLAICIFERNDGGQSEEEQESWLHHPSSSTERQWKLYGPLSSSSCVATSNEQTAAAHYDDDDGNRSSSNTNDDTGSCGATGISIKTMERQNSSASSSSQEQQQQQQQQQQQSLAGFRCAVWYTVQSHEAYAHSFQPQIEQTIARCLGNLMDHLSFHELYPPAATFEHRPSDEDSSEDSSSLYSSDSNTTTNEEEDDGEAANHKEGCAMQVCA
jgi:hypothetical protein